MKRKLLLAVTAFVLAFISPSLCISQGSVPSDSLAAVLTEMEVRMFAAMETADKPAIERMLAPDYITINADGVMESRDQMLQTFGKFKGSTHTLSDRTIRTFGNTAVITGKAKFYFGPVLVAEVFYSELWANHSGEWKFTGWSGTMTGAPSWYPIITSCFLLALVLGLSRWLVRRRKRKQIQSAVSRN